MNVTIESERIVSGEQQDEIDSAPGTHNLIPSGDPSPTQLPRPFPSESPTPLPIWSSRTPRPSPLATLPPELLSIILLLETSKRRYPCLRGPYHDRPSLLSHVCRYWRAVALNTPLLWKRISVNKADMERGRVAEMLRRSQEVPICLYYEVEPEDEDKAIALLRPSLYRTRTLNLFLSRESIPPLVLTILLHTITLRKLVIRHSTGTPLPADIVAASDNRFIIPAGQPFLPYLQTVVVRPRSSSALISPFLLPTVVRLELMNIQLKACIPAAELLHALRDMPLLESVVVKKCIGSIGDSSTDLVADCASLPRLQSLYLTGSTTLPTTWLLDHILYPASAKVAVTCAEELGVRDAMTIVVMAKAAGRGVIQEAPFDAIMDTLSVSTPKVPGDRSTLSVRLFPSIGIVSATEAVNLNPLSHSFSYEGTSVPLGSACTNLDVLCTITPHYLSSIRRLVVTHIRDKKWAFYQPGDTPEVFWSDSLRCLTNLEELVLHGIMFSGLGAPSPSDDASSYTDPPFPRLRLLALRGISYRDPVDGGNRTLSSFAPLWERLSKAKIYIVADRLPEMLAERRKVGLGLPKLQIYECPRFFEEDIGPLLAYVGEVDSDVVAH